MSTRIFGIGTDIVTISRIESLYIDFPDKFVTRILHPKEIEAFKLLKESESPKQIHYLAKAFAAKEAFFKALGTGVRDGLAFKQVCIQRDALGKPTIVTEDVALKMITERKIKSVHLSLSDEIDAALAFVILECESE